MISAQDLIEKITSAANCDDCIVVVKDKTQANLRWAGSTLTTNGVIQERSVTVVAFVAVTGGMASGGVTRTGSFHCTLHSRNHCDGLCHHRGSCGR